MNYEKRFKELIKCKKTFDEEAKMEKYWRERSHNYDADDPDFSRYYYRCMEESYAAHRRKKRAYKSMLRLANYLGSHPVNNSYTCTHHYTILIRVVTNYNNGGAITEEYYCPFCGSTIEWNVMSHIESSYDDLAENVTIGQPPKVKKIEKQINPIDSEWEKWKKHID